MQYVCKYFFLPIYVTYAQPTYSAPAGRNVLQNGGFLDLKTLIELGHIQPGINVLTIEVEVGAIGFTYLLRR